MTPCQELGYKVGDKFIYRDAEGFNYFPEDTVVTLYRDDGSESPLFAGEPCLYNNADGEPGAYAHLDNVIPLDVEAEAEQVAEKEEDMPAVPEQREYKPGDKFRVIAQIPDEAFEVGQVIELYRVGRITGHFKGEPCAFANVPNPDGGGFIPGAFVPWDYVEKIQDAKPQKVKVKPGDTVEVRLSSSSFRAYGHDEYHPWLYGKTLEGHVESVSKNGNPLVSIPFNGRFFAVRIGHGDFWPLGQEPEKKGPFENRVLCRASERLMKDIRGIPGNCTWCYTVKRGEPRHSITVCHSFLRNMQEVSEVLNYPSFTGDRPAFEEFLSNPSTERLNKALNSGAQGDRSYARFTQWLFNDEMFGCYLNPSYEHAMLNGWQVDLSKPYPVVMTSLIMSRIPHEFRCVLDNWMNLVERGVHPRAAVVLGHFYNLGGEMILRDNGHRSFDVRNMSFRDVANLVKGKYTDDPEYLKSLPENNGYGPVNDAFCTSDGLATAMLNTCEDKAFKSKDIFGREVVKRNYLIPEGGLNEVYNNLASMYKKEILPLVGAQV